MGNISNVIPAQAGNAYTYDDVGNRLSMAVTDSSGTRTHVYAYDDSGNMTHDNNYAYGYDPENYRTGRMEKLKSRMSFFPTASLSGLTVCRERGKKSRRSSNATFGLA